MKLMFWLFLFLKIKKDTIKKLFFAIFLALHLYFLFLKVLFLKQDLHN